jgi:hypothetical protein
MQLLEDVFIVENLQILTEGKTGPMKVRGVFQRADEENNNKRIYGKPLLEREITKLAEAITERRLMGELDHPQHDSVKLSNVSHLITGLNMKGNEVIGEAEILDTPAGKVAQALIRGGIKVGISSRGMGTVSEDVDGKRHVNEDFRLITWDLVADPSTRGAYPGLTESTQIQEIIDKVLPEAQKVKNFTTLLKENLDEGIKRIERQVKAIVKKDRPDLHGISPKLKTTIAKQVDKNIYSRIRARSRGDNEPSVGAHTSPAPEGGGHKRGVKKVKGAKGPHEITPMNRMKKKRHKERRAAGRERMAGPKGKLPENSTSLADLVRSRLLETEVPPKDPKRRLAPDPAKEAGAKPNPGPMVQHLKGKRVSQLTGKSDTVKAARKVQRRVKKIVGKKVNLQADVAAQQHTKSKRIKAAQGKQDPIPTQSQVDAADRRRKR